MLDLPNEALVSIFSYLDPIESISCKAVCRRWSKSAGRGVSLLRLRRPQISRISLNFSNDHVLVKNVGKISFKGGIYTRDMNGKDNQTSIHTEPERTRGHLPKPSASIIHDNSLVDASVTVATDRLMDLEPDIWLNHYRNLNSRTDALEAGHVLSMRSGGNISQYLCAIQLEGRTTHGSLDLSSTSSKTEYCYRSKLGGVSDTMIIPKKQNTLRSILEELDLSGLHHLRELSVRGCSKLIRLKLPQSLISLDAGGCTELCQINFPNGADCLKSLDLNGCRALDQLSGLLGLCHLDISSVKGLDDVICSALTSTAASLKTFSCRYSATDGIIKALAGSDSAVSSLRLVDIAFSKAVTDESVELLARSATKLERLNMRGCKKVTAGCYNHIPIYLERRRQNREDDSRLLEEDETLRSSCSRKKGDNLFYFCQGNQGKRKR